MKTTVALVAVLAGLIAGFGAQAYTLPRIGLMRLDFGEYVVAFSILVAGYFVIGVCKEINR